MRSTHRPADPTVPPASTPVARLTIDLGALEANYRQLVDTAAPSEVAAVVKADAYGLGLGPVAGRLAAAGCRTFFVTTADEGVRLRRFVPEARIYVLQGPAAGLRASLEAGLRPVLNCLAEARDWVAQGGGPAALQLDTGMTRAGLDAREWAELLADPALAGTLKLELLLTHLACADEPGHALNAEQVTRFEALRRRLPQVPTSIGNSAGLLIGPAFRGDVVRPGIALYGGRPWRNGANPMRSVVRLEAQVLQLRELAEDAWVGYGATYRARAPARIATLGAGYADGYPRALGGRGIAVAAGRRLPVVGRVSMDLTTIDVTALEPGDLGIGDPVELIGGDIPLDEVAELAGTVSYELLTGLAPRLVRRYV